MAKGTREACGCNSKLWEGCYVFAVYGKSPSLHTAPSAALNRNFVRLRIQGFGFDVVGFRP